MRCLPSGVHALKQIKGADTGTSGSGQSELEETGFVGGTTLAPCRAGHTLLALWQRPCPVLPKPQQQGQCVMSLHLCAGVMPKGHGLGRLRFGLLIGDLARAGPWGLAARQCRVPVWQVPERGLLQAGKLWMDSRLLLPEETPVWIGVPEALLPQAMQSHSPLRFGSLQSLQPAHFGGGGEWGVSEIIPSMCLRIHQVPREESPWYIPGKGSVPPWGDESWGPCCLQSLWFAWLWCMGIGDEGGLNCPPALPWRRYSPSKDPGIPKHSRHQSSAERVLRELPATQFPQGQMLAPSASTM